MTHERASEQRLRHMKVHKPYVTKTDVGWSVESYPHDIRTREAGADTVLAIHDCSLPRTGLPSLVEEETVLFGGDVLSRIGLLILKHHRQAYARAKAQDTAALGSPLLRLLEE